MDGSLAIEYNRQALMRILAALAAMAGLVAGSGTVRATLPRHLHNAVLRLLRPAEAATRRLIIALALAAPPQARKTGNIAVLPPPRSPFRPLKPKPTILRNGIGTGIVMPPALSVPAASTSARRSALPLLDPLPRKPRRRWVRQLAVPRIGFPGRTERVFIPVRLLPSANDPMDATRLARRFAVLASALDDLPAQALRFARWQGRRNRHRAIGKIRRLSPLRLGRPPGWRQKPDHEVHDVLDHAHRLARWALDAPDTS